MNRSSHRSIPTAMLFALFVALLGGCATMPPGADYPKRESVALAHPEDTAIGRNVEPRARAHPGMSGFRLFASGSDAFTLRVQMAQHAERTLDVQYFIFKDDDSGQLLLRAMLGAAERGARVRVLVDDTEARGYDDRVARLAAHPNVDVRLYNPFYYRGNIQLLRNAEFALTMSRLNYRMHNKLFVVDNEIAIVGGRNVGDAYFDTGDALQFGDYDVFALGPIVRELSRSFDAYWNSSLSIPVAALVGSPPKAQQLQNVEAELVAHHDEMKGSEQERAIRSGRPYAALLESDAGLTWAKAQVLADSPDKASVEDGSSVGALFRRTVLRAAADVKSELLLVTPYFVPGVKGEELLTKLRARGVRVRVLTNSLLSTDVPAVHAGYRHYREPLLAAGVDLYEVKPSPGKPTPQGGALKAPSSGQFSLHAKAFVFDRKRLFIGSANFDRRSLHLNTEIGLMIESPQLAQQVVTRFETIAQPANSFVLALEGSGKESRHIVWNSVKDGRPVVYDTEPGDDRLRGLKVDLLSMLPIDELL
jgi:putative cardiolipin synthase